MIIISKKRISFIIIVLVVTVFSYGITTMNSKNKEAIATTSLPVSNKTIILDAGHGKPDEGAESRNRN